MQEARARVQKRGKRLPILRPEVLDGLQGYGGQYHRIERQRPRCPDYRSQL